MKPIYILIACLLLPGVVRAQGGAANPDSSANRDSSVNDAKLAAEINSLREALSQTQKQMAAQQREIEILKAQSKNAEAAPAANELPASPSGGVIGNAAPAAIESKAASANAKVQLQQSTQ